MMNCYTCMHFKDHTHLSMNSGDIMLVFGVFWLFVCLAFCFFQGKVLCSLSCPRTHSIHHAGLELRDPLASVSWGLGLKVCTTTPNLIFVVIRYDIFIVLYMMSTL